MEVQVHGPQCPVHGQQPHPTTMQCLPPAALTQGQGSHCHCTANPDKGLQLPGFFPRAQRPGLRRMRLSQSQNSWMFMLRILLVMCMWAWAWSQAQAAGQQVGHQPVPFFNIHQSCGHSKTCLPRLPQYLFPEVPVQHKCVRHCARQPESRDSLL